ncbi:organic cation transporter-like protein [Mercenaria mercenaria]|uniref:organic cation transporter-like protein n=1 Tax=Mercenaria mercenaria TaxID=6596 RepID=UPI00234EF075|nr:organic cation transporter-like protein [Mercenaria mercenaria]
MRNVNVDHIWRTLGPLGKYQLKQQAIYLLSLISWAFQGLNIVFIGHRPGFHCKPTHNGTLMNNTLGIQKDYEQCEIVSYVNTSDGVLETSTPCENGWEYDSPADRSFVTEWNLVCQNAELGELTQVLYLAGMMIGTFVFPTLSDRFGRKPVMILSHVVFFGVSLATAFSANYVVFVIFRFLTGLFQQGLLAGTTLSLETFPTEIRHYCAVWALLFWTSVTALMSPIAYALRDYPWKYIQITYAMCSAWSILQWWTIDESLCWVIANNQIDRAKEIIKNACKWNKKNYGEVMETIGLGDLVDTDSKALPMNNQSKSKNVEYSQISEANMDAFFRQISGIDYPSHGQKNGNIGNNSADLDPLILPMPKFKDSNDNLKNGEFDDDKIEVRKYTMFDIFKHKRILIVSMILWYTWICDSFVYYGLYLSSSALYGDRYINFFLSALVEYPSCFMQYFILHRIGRKWTAVIGHCIAAIGLGVATALTFTAGENTTMLGAATAFMLIGKMGITTGYNTVYLTTPELYPTNMRNIGLGVCSFMEKVGSMIAPFSRNVSSKIGWLPPCVFAVMCLITVLLFAFVPETNGVELPQTIEELSDWYRVNKFELKIGKNKRASKKTEDTDTKNDQI